MSDVDQVTEYELELKVNGTWCLIRTDEDEHVVMERFDDLVDSSDLGEYSSKLRVMEVVRVGAHVFSATQIASVKEMEA